MRTLHWTIRCDSCPTTSTMVADSSEDPLVLTSPLIETAWVRDGAVDICHKCQLKAVVKRMEPDK